MPYGIKVTGNDAGGDYTVTDTENNLINYSVVAAGTGSSVTLGSGITKQPLIFVNAKGVTDATGSYTILDESNDPYTMQAGVLVTWTQSTRTAAFFTSRIAWQTDRFQAVNTSRSMSYFIAVDSSDVPSSQHSSDTYGIQILTSGSAVAVDSRRFPTNKTFDVTSVLPSGSSSNSTITTDEDAYIEMSQTYTTTASQYGGSNRRLIKFNSTDIDYYGENVDLDPNYPFGTGPFIVLAATNRPIQVATLT